MADPAKTEKPAAPPAKILTPEQAARKKEKEAAKAAKAAKFAAKKAAQAAAAANKKASGGDAKAKKEKAKKEAPAIRLRTEFVNPTPPGEKKDLAAEPMASSYDPPAVEAAWYEWWEAQGYFTPATHAKPGREPFVIVIPPPNVTGTLHLGHALTNAVQDTLVRFHRMAGYDTVWVPGTDHAGIATQRVVERSLARQEPPVNRHDLGREAFVGKVWEWKEEYGNRIFTQLRRLGSSVDWTRERFTMDDLLSRAVTHSFERFFDEGLIYRSDRLTNHCCALETAISDIEVDYIELTGPSKIEVPGHEEKVEFGKLWKFAYRVEGGAEGDELVVATTRPETMLGDTAVAVHPKDPRYASFHGKFLVHPFVEGRRIPVILDDELVDMSFGTGAVKITPAHDPNDYKCGQKHNLEQITVFDRKGIVNEHGGPKFAGMPRFVARKAVLAALDEAGLGRGTEPNPMRLGLCSRTKDVIEPLLCPQWYMKMEEMQKRAYDAVKDGELEIVPKMHEISWYRWLEDPVDWCISRQLWWGHRIPAYYVTIEGAEAPLDPNESSSWVSAADEAAARAKAAEKFGVAADRISLRQDEDVLDTWYSSGLFPMSVFHWPDEEHPDYSRFFPGSVLETGHDILFFWVARMVMMSLHLTNKLPFKRVLLHAMVRDAHGKKMSKSKGNVVDPIDVMDGITLDDLLANLHKGNLPAAEIEEATRGQRTNFPKGIPECGADALRFGLCAYTSQGRSINLDINRVAAYRNFCNKLWNIVRFTLSNLDGFTPAPQAALAAAEVTGADDADLAVRRAKENDAPRGEDGLVRVEHEWILSRLAAAAAAADGGLRAFDMGAAADAVHHFWLKDLADVFLEVSKPLLRSEDKTLIKTTQEVLYTCLDVGLRLLHPFMPFVTEELWQRLPRRPATPATAHLPVPESIMIAPYPLPAHLAHMDSPTADEAKELALAAVSAVRSLRGKYTIPKSTKISLRLVASSDAASSSLSPWLTAVGALVWADCTPTLTLSASSAPEKGEVSAQVSADVHVLLRLAGLIDVEAELARRAKKTANSQKKLENLRKRMGIAGYEEKVPAEVRESNREAEELLLAEIAADAATVASLEAVRET
jgi:valyl-tRNA synthetase